MTSLEIAELTGKQHCHVMEAIRKMEPAWMKVNGSNFRLVEYRDKKGELRPRESISGTARKCVDNPHPQQKWK
jgi:phage regulator Rha-like protein